MMEEPIVIDPPGFDLATAWESCREDRENVVDAEGEVNWGAAFGADPGVTSCPACQTYHWAWGRRQRCTKCAFEYPVGWNHIVGEGQGDRGTLPLASVPPERPDDPYYMHGWTHPTLPYEALHAVDWPEVVTSFMPWRPTEEESRAIAAAVEGDCKHYRGTMQGTCAAGVGLRALVGGEDAGWCTRLPCLQSFRNRPNGPTAACNKFAVPTAEEVAADEAERAEMIARFEKLGPIRSRIKRENKGQSADGIVECPACGGKLHWSHAAYNGHVHLKCENEDCVWIIE
jgi:hypothetical protein